MATFMLGAAILMLEERAAEPDPMFVGAGLALIGATGAGRLQEWAKRRLQSSEENGTP